MTTDKRLDESITRWLEETAPGRLPDRTLEATFERTRRSRQQAGWRGLLGRTPMIQFAPALGGAAVVVVAAALALNFAIVPGVGGPTTAPAASDLPNPFVGTWSSTSDHDGGTQTMIIRAPQAGAVEIVVTDDIASVCSRTPSTMTGNGRPVGSTQLVIATPAYACDDGSKPQALSGPPLQQQLRNLTYVYDAQAETLTDNFGGVWLREGAAAPSPELPVASPAQVPGGAPSGCVDLSTGGTYSANAGTISVTATVPAGWQGLPDTFYLLKAPCKMGGSLSIEAAQVGQVYSDACQWQGTGVEATTPAAVTAALAAQRGHETIGPTAVTIGGRPASRFEFSVPADLDRETCGDGTLLLAPEDPLGHSLSNIDPGTKMTVYVVDVIGSPVIVALRVTAVEEATAADIAELDPIVASLQFGEGADASASPPVGAELTALLNGFLDARVAGAGAQQYLNVAEKDVPLLYATTSGASYERAEFEQVRGIEWPYGWSGFKVRLFAGETVVEQLFFIGRDGPPWLEYQPDGFGSGIAPTTENGQPVAVPHTYFDGEVTLRAAHPWIMSGYGLYPFGRLIPEGPGVRPTTDGGERHDWDNLVVMADPKLDGAGCEADPDPADATAVAESLRADPDLRATAPIAVSVGQLEAVMMDVKIATGTTISMPASEGGDYCRNGLLATLLDQGAGASETFDNGVLTGRASGEWMRLYLLDAPEGSSMRTLALAIVAPEASFERAVEAAKPVVDSIEFHAP